MFPPPARRFGHVLNVHSVHLEVPQERAGALLDTLGSDTDELWPGEHWPPMRIDGPLRVGAEGRHGPVAYSVDEYVPSTRVCFRFREPVGFVGTHTFFRPCGGRRMSARAPRGDRAARAGATRLAGRLRSAARRARGRCDRARRACARRHAGAAAVERVGARATRARWRVRSSRAAFRGRGRARAVSLSAAVRRRGRTRRRPQRPTGSRTPATR